MSVFYFTKNIHHANIDNEITILDEISDQYILLSKEQTGQLINYMRNGQDNSTGKKLSQKGLINIDDGTPVSDSIPSPVGAGLLYWNSDVSLAGSVNNFFLRCEAILRLILVKRRLKRTGLHGCLEICRDKLTHADFDNLSNLKRAEEFGILIKMGAPFIPGKVKCLEFSLTLFDMLLAHHIRPTLFIGYQRYDFLSHAWVEVNNVVISDIQNLNSRLTPILKVL